MTDPHRILILKTGALGDVLRTTSILSGLHERFPGCEVHWFTATGARSLVEHHPLVAQVWSGDPERSASKLRKFGRFDWVLSLDDERPMCELAAALDCDKVSGATVSATGECTYTADTAPWFEMGLLSKLGKAKADAMKRENELSHPEIYASMFGIEKGKPRVELPVEDLDFARDHLSELGVNNEQSLLGLNTGAGGRWRTKELPIDRVADLVMQVAAARSDAQFLLLGGPAEAARTAEIVDRVRSLPGGDAVKIFDAGSNHSLLRFAALIDACDALLTSDSMALHVGVARDIPLVAFFAPTSAAEIDLYGGGEKVVSTAPDYCSYARDADNSTITVERLLPAVLRQLDPAPAPK